MEFVPQNFHILREKGIFRGYSSAHIAQPLRLGAKLRHHGKYAAHGPQFAITFNALRKQHKPPAFRIDGQTGIGPSRKHLQMRRGAERCCPVFRKTTAKIQAVNLAARRPLWITTAQYRPLTSVGANDLKPHQFRPCTFQSFKVFLIIKPQGAVAHIGNARAQRCGIGRSRTNGMRGFSHRPELLSRFCGSICPRPVCPSIRCAGGVHNVCNINVLAHKRAQRFQHCTRLWRKRIAARGNAHVPLRQGIFFQARQHAQHAYIGVFFNNFAQQVFVPRCSHLIEHHARELQTRLKGGHAVHKGRCCTGHLGAVDAKNYGAGQHACQLCC